MPLFSSRSHMTRKDVSFDPGRYDLTDDTSAKTKKEVVTKERQVLAMLDSLADGKLPTNEQLEKLIDVLGKASLLGSRRSQLSDVGAALARDFDELLETLKKVLREKNYDEGLQQFLFHTRLASSLTAARAKATVEPGKLASKAAEAAEASSNVLQQLTTILRLLVTSAEFRELLFDMNDVLQDILASLFGQEAHLLSQKAQQMRSSETRGRGALAAPIKGLVSAGRDSSKSSERSLSSLDAAGGSADNSKMPSMLGGADTPTPKDEQDSAAKKDDEEFKEAREDDIQDDQAKTHESKETLPDRLAVVESTPRRQEDHDEVEPQLALLPRAVQQHLAKAADVVDEELTPERKQQLRRQVAKLVRSLSENDAFREAIGNIVKNFSSLSGQMDELEQHRRIVMGDANVDVAKNELKTFVERFAGGRSLDYLFEALQRLEEALRDDFELRTYVDDVSQFLHRSVTEPQYLDNRDYGRRIDQLLHRGRAVLRARCGEQVRDVLHEMDEFVRALRHDELTHELAAQVKKISRHLFVNEAGRYTFKTELLRDIATVLVPVAFEQMKFVPIPRIEHEDEHMRLVVEDIVLSSSNFLPNVMEVKLRNTLVLGLRKELPSSSAHDVTLNFYQIQCHVQDVPFYYKKKTGFPRMSDCGVASVLIGGHGIALRLKLRIDQASTSTTLVPVRVECHVDNLDITIQHSQRDTLYRMFSAALSGLVKRQIQNAVEAYAREAIAGIDVYATKIKRSLFAESMKRPTTVSATIDRYLGIGKQGFPGSLFRRGSSKDALYGQDEGEDVSRSAIRAPWFSESFSLGAY